MEESMTHKQQTILSSLLISLLFVGASFCGALARVALQDLIIQKHGAYFLGVFVVNCLGCFLFGFIWTVFSTKDLRIALTGFMGSFTTFATFIADSHLLLQTGKILQFITNYIGQLALGLVLLQAGILLGTKLFKKD